MFEISEAEKYVDRKIVLLVLGGADIFRTFAPGLKSLQEQDADEYRREIRQDICTGGLEVLDSERHCHYPQDDAQGKDDGEHQSL